MFDASRIGRLRWRCRRGMRELDMVMSGELDRLVERADAAQLGHFERLLEVEDPILWKWVLGANVPEDADFRLLIDEIRTPHPA